VAHPSSIATPPKNPEKRHGKTGKTPRKKATEKHGKTQNKPLLSVFFRAFLWLGIGIDEDASRGRSGDETGR
jgi:hypothetical protein